MNTASYGEIVCWTVRDAAIKKAELESALESGGFETRPPEIEKRTYLRRALDAATHQHGDFLIRLIGEDATRISYAVVTEQRMLDSAEWYGRMHESVVLHKADNQLEFRVSDPDMVRSVTAMIKKLEGVLNSNEIAACIKKVVVSELQGIALRDTGGVYFVPACNTARLTDLENLLAELRPPHATIRIHRLRVIAGPREAQDIAKIFCESVLEDSEKLKREALQSFKEHNGGTFRKTAYQVRAKKIGALIDVTKTYEATLSTTLRDTIDRLAKTRKSIMRCLALALQGREQSKGKKTASAQAVIDEIEEE